MRKVFVSGCFDIIHGGHIDFFMRAKSLGDHLTVNFASDRVLYMAKGRCPAIPDEHKMVVLKSIRYIDEVVSSSNVECGLDYRDWFIQNKPDILAVTEDDAYSTAKKELCALVGAEYIVLPKVTNGIIPISTTDIRKRIISFNS